MAIVAPAREHMARRTRHLHVARGTWHVALGTWHSARAPGTWHSARGTWYDAAMVCDPLGDLRAWQGRLERLALHHTEAWVPPIDVHEIADAYVLTVEVPGLKRDDIELLAEASRLTVRGRRVDRHA